MLKKIIDFFTGKKPAPAEPVDTWQPVVSAPYKVPEPAATTPIPFVPEVWPVAEVAKPVAKPKVVAKPKAVAKPVAKPKAAAKPALKAAAIKAPAKPKAAAKKPK